MLGVYQIKNCVNKKVYVGSSVDVERRLKNHLKELRSGQHFNGHLQASWNKYGEDAFEFSVLEEVLNPEELREREKYYIKLLDCVECGYNYLNDTNIGLGVAASPIIRAKISKACSGERNGNFGRKHTAEELVRMRNNRWGEGYVCKTRKSYARGISDEVRKQRSDRMKNRTVTEATRDKLREIAKNRKFSDSTRAKMSKNASGMSNPNCKLSPEQVWEIFYKMNNGVNYKLICSEYGIGSCQAYKIKRKEHWVFRDNK